jgi:hypothetical protein
MTRSPQRPNPHVGLGLTSLALGSVGLGLFFLPVLGIPLSGFGLAFGVAGLLVALLGGPSSFRWSVGGTALGVLALGVNLAIAQAPAGYVGSRPVPTIWETVPDRPYVPPPARPSSEPLRSADRNEAQVR